MQTQGRPRSTICWALVVASCTGVALGCSDPRKAIESIAREELAALSLAAGNNAGASSEGPTKAAPKGVAPLAAAAADEEGADEATPPTSARGQSTRGRRRRAGSGADARVATGIDAAPGDGAEERAPGVAALKVTRLVMASGIAGREPMGLATSFASAEVESLYAFVELSNETRAASEIDVKFTPPGGGASQRVHLDVGTLKRWRTWAATRKARAPGEWSVAVSDAGGNVLARTTFTITK